MTFFLFTINIQLVSNDSVFSVSYTSDIFIILSLASRTKLFFCLFVHVTAFFFSVVPSLCRYAVSSKNSLGYFESFGFRSRLSLSALFSFAYLRDKRLMVIRMRTVKSQRSREREKERKCLGEPVETKNHI